jgi:acyl-CoA dehydrogenase
MLAQRVEIEAQPLRAPAPREPFGETPIERARGVAAIAALHADEVDAKGRFPQEAVDALKTERLLGAMVPIALGGDGASVADLAEVCFRLGQSCASTAMIFAMHQIKAACLVEHFEPGSWHEHFLAKVAADQLLLASSTTEGQGGGDVRSSTAAIELDRTGIRLERAATVMSYGEQADAVVTTARRAPDAASNDQVLVVFERADYSLTRTLEWETLGMRGTRSAGFAMKAQGRARQVVAAPYADIHARTMTPVAHLLWSSVWAGIATAAVERARLFLRKAARGGQTPPAAAHFTRAQSQLRALRALIGVAMGRYEAARLTPQRLEAMDFQTEITLLKVEASEAALAIVMAAMRTCGLSGYRNDGDASQGRHLRDVLSAPIMINNDRILANLGPAPLIAETSRDLFASTSFASTSFA